MAKTPTKSPQLLPISASDLRSLPNDKAQEILSQLSPKKLEELKHEWRFWARPEQLELEGDWNVWFINAGRGFGKTRAGVEWIREKVKRGLPTAHTSYSRPDMAREWITNARDQLQHAEQARETFSVLLDVMGEIHK